MSVQLVDVTLRDGGYVNGYGFTQENVLELSKALEEAGINMIEIGHGYGLGAERNLKSMECSSEEYISCLEGELDDAMFGMFAMAGICTEEDIEMASEKGMDFIRIGFVGREGDHGLDKCIPLLEKAMEEGLWVSANFLKPNIYTRDEISEISQELEEIGVENVYLVDSTGGILPEEMEDLVSWMSEEFEFDLGVHAHQNLDVGVWNSVKAIEAGAKYADGTLGGIGRDSGNAQLEAIAAILERKGFDTGIDLYGLAEASEQILDPIIDAERLINEENLILGFNKIHTLALGPSKEMAEEYDIDWRDLIGYLHEKNIKFEDPELIEEYAQELEEAEK